MLEMGEVKYILTTLNNVEEVLTGGILLQPDNIFLDHNLRVNQNAWSYL